MPHRFPRTHVSDERDSRRKVAYLRELIESDPAVAIATANAIAANPSWLDGLGPIVARLARVDEAAAILERVFAEHARSYPRTYLAYVDARLKK